MHVWVENLDFIRILKNEVVSWTKFCFFAEYVPVLFQNLREKKFIHWKEAEAFFRKAFSGKPNYGKKLATCKFLRFLKKILEK